MNCQQLNDTEYKPRQKELPKISCIYKILSKSTNRFYIGSAKQFSVRMRNHISQLEKNKHHSRILQNHVNKYTIYDLTFYILEVIEWSDNVYNIEQRYLDLLKPYFNIQPNANGSKGRKASDETIQKLINSHLGKKQSELTKQRRSFSMILAASKLTETQKQNRLKSSVLKKIKVICNENGIIYDSVIDAEKQTGCKNVSAICKGKRKKSLGLTFNYYKNEL